MNDNYDNAHITLSEEDLAALEEEIPLLTGVRLFAEQAVFLPWFSMLGRRPTPEIKNLSRAYLDGLGFPDVDIALIADWDDAAGAAESFSYDTAQWEAEEALRAGLAADALENISEDALSIALTHVSALLADRIRASVREAAAFAEQADEALINAAAGAGLQAAQGIALALLAGAEQDHPFQHKFALFARGRWPIAISGLTLNLF